MLKQSYSPIYQGSGLGLVFESAHESALVRKDPPKRLDSNDRVPVDPIRDVVVWDMSKQELFNDFWTERILINNRRHRGRS